MALRLQRLDPDRRRKRLALLAELAGAKSLSRASTHQRNTHRGVPVDRVRELIAVRRHLAD
jgi:hypothetical protein